MTPQDKMLWESLMAIDQADHYNDWLASYCLPHLQGDIIEVGSGIGTLARSYDLPAVSSATLTDIAPMMLKLLRERYGSKPKCRVRELDILMPEGIPQDVAGRFDRLISLNVLEHIEDHVLALRRMGELLRPQGKVVLLVPAMPFLYGSIDQAVGHFRRYTCKSLITVAAEAGFQVEQAYYVNFFGIFTWFLGSRILRRQKVSAGACQLLNRIVPILRAMESFCKPPLGQSVVYIGRKSH